MRADESCAERGVAAQIYFAARRKPAQAEFSIRALFKKGCFREIVFDRNRLHPSVGKRRFENADGGRIARKQAIRKGVDNKLLDFHFLFLRDIFRT